MKIIVASVLSMPPFTPGRAWHRLNYLLGLQELGHDVYFVEEVGPDWCVDAQCHPSSFESSENARLFHATMTRFGLWEHACLLFDGGAATVGMSFSALRAVAREADLLVNMSGHLKTPAVLEAIRRRAYLDQDPVYTQLWHTEYKAELGFKAHQVFFTRGLNIGTELSSVPTCGIEWHPVLPPVALPYWKPFSVPAGSAFTTIASWRSADDIAYQDTWYRSKYSEFVRLADLPIRTGQDCEAMLKNHHPEEPGIQEMRAGGWILKEASNLNDLDAYQGYIARSRAEIGIAKHAYVQGNSGWFSERSAHYLASGKPVLARATGFEHHLPTDAGLLAFETPEDAVAAVEAINADYAMHSEAAQVFAETHLDARRILPQMLDIAMA